MSAPAPLGNVVDRHSRVVFLVEDDTGLRRALERLLLASGFDARSCGSAEEALRTFDTERADCLVVDVNLPAMSGLELIDRLRERRLGVPAVVISAQDEPHIRDGARARGAAHFLAKPFPGSALVRAVDRACGA